MPDLRVPFAESLTEIAKEDDRLVFITADVGFNALEPLKADIGDRFINVGITEHQMMGLAAGLANEGLIPYVYSMVPFVIFRPFEMVRNLIDFDNRNVKILGVSGSEAYKFLGRSHSPIGDEDFHVLSRMENLLTFRPQDAEMARLTARAMHSHIGPCYARI